jgi:hypothetical protein
MDGKRQNMTVTLQATVENQDAIDAFFRAIRLVSDAAKDQPWNEDVVEALDLLRTVAWGIEFKMKPRLGQR